METETTQMQKRLFDEIETALSSKSFSNVELEFILEVVKNIKSFVSVISSLVKIF